MKTYVSLILMTVNAAALAVGLAACQPRGAATAQDDSKALREEGYVRAPQVLGVSQTGAKQFEVTGQASEGIRVNIVYSFHGAAGQTTAGREGFDADSKGRFTHAVPSGPAGGIYDVSVEALKREVPAEGRLFVPLGSPAKAVMLMPGGASRPVSNDRNVMAVIDYDGAGGLAVAGRVEAGKTVNLLQDGVIIGRSQSDDTGRYRLTSQIAAPGDQPATITLVVEAGSDRAERTIQVSRAAGGDVISRLPDGWRVDWTLPGGGIQTTLVY